MSGDDLIECLAREMADAREDVTWERVSKNHKFLYRGDAASMLPGVVAFVAEWLDGADLYADAEGSLNARAVRLWREEMGA